MRKMGSAAGNRRRARIAFVKTGPAPTLGSSPMDCARLIEATRRCKLIGSDLKEYGPILGAKVLQWFAEGRIDGQTPAQLEGSAEWKPLEP